jgi:hypothetical protein
MWMQRCGHRDDVASTQCAGLVCSRVSSETYEAAIGDTRWRFPARQPWQLGHADGAAIRSARGRSRSAGLGLPPMDGSGSR